MSIDTYVTIDAILLLEESDEGDVKFVGERFYRFNL